MVADTGIPLGPEDLLIPCGHCNGCARSKARDWTIRCRLELQQHKHACWCTLTYDDKSLPPTLRKDHLSGFIKRLRARRPDLSIRFFGCGEYGETFGRPHYHAILFGISQLDLLRELAPRVDTRSKQVPAPIIRSVWPFGLAQVHALRMGAISYVAGYVSKKYNEPRQPRDTSEHVSADGEVYVQQPPFLLMSRNPGIGANAKRTARDFRKRVHLDGQALPAPRYLRLAYRAQATEAQLEQLDKENLHDRIERLKADPRPLREQFRSLMLINQSRAKAQQEKRTL